MDGFDESGLLAAAARYERALREDDLDALDALFAPGARTLRAEGGTALVGHGEIAAFRRARGGAPARRLRRVHLHHPAPGTALTVSESERPDGGRGLQTQLWQRGPEGWRITAAHVSSAPPAVPAPDPADPAWTRASATPPPGAPPDPRRCPRAARSGPLRGVRVAVKDLIAVAGQRTGAGVPRWLERAPVETGSAPVLRALLAAGAEVAGIAQTDELAFSLTGTNAHYGTPPNAAAPGRVPGGSTSGPAAALAAGEADLGLGTDTAGSLRVPGSFSALHAWRPTHGLLDTTGVLPLAPAFDTVGLLARRADVLTAAAEVLLAPTGPPGAVRRPRALLRSRTLLGLAEPATALAVEAALRALAVQTGLPVLDLAGGTVPGPGPAAPSDLPPDFTPGEVTAWTDAFRTVQAAQAWACHGGFVTANPGALSPAVEARFRAGADLAPEEVEAALAVTGRVRDRLERVLEHGWLCLPSTATPAPPADAGPERLEAARAGTLRLSTLASQAGVPALGLPWGRVGGLPVGLCVLAPRGADRSLLALLAEVAPAGPGAP